MSTSIPVTPRPAAVVVLLRERPDDAVAVFMVRRHVQSEFMPDVFVFPGGSITADDRAVEATPGLCHPAGDGPTGLGSGFRAAAIRECFEEAGVLLALRGGAPLAIAPADVPRFAEYRDGLNARRIAMSEVLSREGLTLATDSLLHWAHWITPDVSPKRFDTHFFLAAMPEAQEAAHDRLETSAGLWVTPEEAIAQGQRGALPLADVTAYQLRQLSGLDGIAAAWARFGGVQPRTMRPGLAWRDGKEVMVLDDSDQEGARGER